MVIQKERPRGQNTFGTPGLYQTSTKSPPNFYEKITKVCYYRITEIAHCCYVFRLSITGASEVYIMGASMSLAILIYGPDGETNEEIAKQLHSDGFAVNTAVEERETLRKLHNDIPGLIIVDINDDDEQTGRRRFCRNVRALSDVPLALIANPVDKRIQEFVKELGAENTYLVELPARRVVNRVEDILGHTVSPAVPSRMSLHVSEGLWIDFATRQVRAKGNIIDLTPKEFELLSCLARNAGRLFTSEELIELVWGGQKSDRAALKAYVWRLRQKIEETPKRPRYIMTRRGVGYFFKKQVA